MGEDERAGLRIVEFSAIVALDALDGGVKLCVNIYKKNWREWKMSRI